MVKVDEKKGKINQRTFSFGRIEFLDGTYIIDEKDGNIDRD